MRSSSIFIFFSLSSWVWLSETWVTGFILTTLIFLNKITSLRWHITQKQFHRWGDLSIGLVITMVIYVYVFEPIRSQPIFIVLKWLPILFLPALLSQLFSQQQRLPLGTLFYSMRHRPPKMIDFQIPYAAITLLSASAANHQGVMYYLMVVIFFTGVIMVNRPLKNSMVMGIMVMIIAITCGYFGYHGLKKLHNWLENKTVAWMGSWHSDPFKGRTAIGDLGQLKLSDTIELRIKADKPLLLLQASYDVYLGQQWVTSSRLFSSTNPIQMSDKVFLKKMTLTQAFKHKKILSLPDGTVKIKGLEGAKLAYTPFGAVKISEAPSLATYDVFYTEKRVDSPNQYDLKIPKQHQDWLTTVENTLALTTLNPQQIALKIEQYFHKNFYYTLYLGDERDSHLALKDFILTRKAGHCEYFAVASVLLLRQAGIPARLATGYAMSEYDSERKHYVVRHRHAHAWAIAYIDGQWQAVDSTPAQWLIQEENNASGLQPLNDWIANQLLAFKQWRMKRIEDESTPLWWIALVILLLYLLLRLYHARRQLTPQNSLEHQQKIKHGSDSMFYLVEDALEKTGFAREDNESLQQWVQRIHSPELHTLCRLHYQLRFDPHGVSDAQKEGLEKGVTRWLKSN